jgi:Rod binding domain-containing protein
MSTPIAPTTTAATGLSITDEAHAPAVVRNGSATVKKAYASAQGFEEMLLQQLSQSMLQSSGLGGEGASEGEESSGEGSSRGEGGMLTSLLPQALTEGVMREGGLGLATQLTSSLDPAAGAAASGASAAGATTSGGTAPLQSASAGEVAAAGSAAAGASVDSTGGVSA